eukprot:3459891-Pyramimonas_sp.AAC.1
MPYWSCLAAYWGPLGALSGRSGAHAEPAGDSIGALAGPSWKLSSASCSHGGHRSKEGGS